MIWWMVYQGYTMAQASVLTWVLALMSGDPGRLGRDLWIVLDVVDPEVALAFYVTWWLMMLTAARDELARMLGVTA